MMSGWKPWLSVARPARMRAAWMPEVMTRIRATPRVAQGASVQSGESLAFAEQKNAGQAAVSAGHGVFLAYTKGHGATSAAVAFTLYI